jgi:hypothetical protein
VDDRNTVVPSQRKVVLFGLVDHPKGPDRKQGDFMEVHGFGLNFDIDTKSDVM